MATGQQTGAPSMHPLRSFDLQVLELRKTKNAFCKEMVGKRQNKMVVRFETVKRKLAIDGPCII